MFSIKIELLLFIFHVSNCQRRIQDGEIVTENKPYVVYLLKASISEQYYDGWMCGGALVTTEFIVTSAACVTDVAHLYAIAGYKKYVKDTEIHTDACTKEKKKKVVTICTPKEYEFKYEEIEKWSYVDIAVVRVESPYDLTDASYETVCSYIPTTISINNEQKYQEPGVDSIVFGWGHRKKWRETTDATNYNEEVLNYAPTLIADKARCKKEYESYPGMGEVIDKYMICTMDSGNINVAGEMIMKSPPTAQGCSVKPDIKQLKGPDDGYDPSIVNTCEPEAGGDEIVLIDNYRRSGINNSVIDKINVTDPNIAANISKINIVKPKLIKHNGEHVYPRVATRRHGICQNDHGGPLVTWVGSHEFLIGVASVFKITEQLECTGPYLFTSTQCNGAFLDCILRFDENIPEPTRRTICDAPAEQKGFELVEKHISWKDHPDGPADNEKNTTTDGTLNLSNNITLNSLNNTEQFSNNNINITMTNLNNTTNENLSYTEKVNLVNSTTTLPDNNATTIIIKTNIASNNLTNSTNSMNNTLTNPEETRNINILNTTTTYHITGVTIVYQDNFDLNNTISKKNDMYTTLKNLFETTTLSIDNMTSAVPTIITSTLINNATTNQITSKNVNISGLTTTHP